MTDPRVEAASFCPRDADESDEVLLDRLGDLVESLDPVPASVLADARRLFSSCRRSPRSPSDARGAASTVIGAGIRAHSQL
jgi:hypothetical protein